MTSPLLGNKNKRIKRTAANDIHLIKDMNIGRIMIKFCSSAKMESRLQFF
jgi:hypothetical protein